MVRVASLKDMVHANYTKRDIAGMTAQEQLDAIDGKTHELVENQYPDLQSDAPAALKTARSARGHRA